MRQEGHIGLNMVLASPIIAYLYFMYGSMPAVLFGSLMFFMSPIPDIDIKLQKMPFVPITHRGITHTIWFALLTGGFFGIIIYGMDYSLILVTTGFLGGFLGITGHVLGDIVTPTGINFTPPLTSSNKSLDLFYFDNTVANIGFPLIAVVTIVLSIGLGSKSVITPTDVLLYAGIYVVSVSLVLILGKLIGFRMGNRRSLWFTNYTSPIYIIKKLL